MKIIIWEEHTTLSSIQRVTSHDHAMGKIAIKRLSTDSIPKVATITVLGHIDHGKTSLINSITQQKTEMEIGNITQHLKIHNFKYKGIKLTILDTPGHSLFINTRLNTIYITDIIILVISLQEGIKRQTWECLDYILKQGIPTIIAYTKLDCGLGMLSKIRTELINSGITLKELGGNIIEICISTKTNENIKHLLDTLCILLDLWKPECDIGMIATGIIMDVRLVKGQGPIVSVFLIAGILTSGQTIAIGNQVTNIWLRKGLQFAIATSVIDIMGLSHNVKSNQSFGLLKQPFWGNDAKPMTNYTNTIANAIIKTDTFTSSEGILNLLNELNFKVLWTSVGIVTATNVTLASASNALIIAFNTKVMAEARKLSNQLKVTIIESSLIYELANVIRNKISQFYVPITIASVFRVFYLGEGTAYGAHLIEGEINVGQRLTVYRVGRKPFFIRIKSLRRYNVSVNKVSGNGQEFGFVVFEGIQIKIHDRLGPLQYKHTSYHGL